MALSLPLYVWCISVVRISTPFMCLKTGQNLFFGFSKNTFSISWQYHGIPKHAQFALAKEIEIYNLMESLKGNTCNRISEDMIYLDYQEYTTIH